MGSTNTNFEFDFSVDGEEWPFFLAGGEALKDNDNGEMIWLLSTIGATLCLCCCLGAPVGCCCVKCIRKIKEDKE